jgi:hypothetical protein
MKKFESKSEMESAAGIVSSALFELRDALVELSLSLKDLQFEADLVTRKNTELAVQKLLQKITSNQGPTTL